MKIDKNWLSKYLAWVIMILAWVVIIGIRMAKPETSLKTPIIISGIISVLALISLFAKKLNFASDKKEILKLSMDDVHKLILIEADKRENNLRINKPYENPKTMTVKNDIIYAVKVNLNIDNEEFIFIVNLSEPKFPPTVMSARDENGQLISNHIIEREMNHKARNPDKESNIIEKELTKDEFGRPVERVKETRFAEQKEEKVEEGL